MWRQFLICGYHVAAKIYDNPSKFGILGFSRVSKMDVVDASDNLVLQYERGWVFNDLPEDTYHEILKHLSDLIGGLI